MDDAARNSVLMPGLVGTDTALWMATANIQSLWDTFISPLGVFISALVGLFILGTFTRRTSSYDAFSGAIASAVITLRVGRYTHIHIFLYATIGLLSCVSIGFLASCLLLRGRSIGTDFW